MAQMFMAQALKTKLDAPQALSASEVLARLGVSVSKGLSDEDIRDRQKIFGPNTVLSICKASGLIILLRQFRSSVAYLLSAAAALAFYFGELEEGATIVAVLAVNALIGFLTELKAGTLDRGVASAWVAFGTRAPRRPCPHHTGRATGARRHRRTGRRATPSPPTCGWWRLPMSSPTSPP